MGARKPLQAERSDYSSVTSRLNFRSIHRPVRRPAKLGEHVLYECRAAGSGLGGVGSGVAAITAWRPVDCSLAAYATV